jgi:hypothetical protein
MIKTTLFTLLLLQWTICGAAAQVIVTEISPANGTILDRNHASSDWLELTAISATVNLKGWRISDKNNFDKAYILPDTVLNQGQSAMVFCTQDKNTHPVTTLIGDAAWIGRWSSWERNTFAYMPLSGDFTMTVRINSLHHDSVPTEAVLLLRDNTYETSRYIGIAALSNKTTIIHQKPSTNPNADGLHFKLHPYPAEVKFPQCWLKLQKKGDTISLAASADGYYWAEEQSLYFPFPQKEFLAGIAIAPTNYVYSKELRLHYSELRINDKEYPNGFPLIANIKTNKPASQSKNKEIHAPFQLSASQEKLYLWNPDGKLIDTLSWSDIPGNRTWGRDSLLRQGFLFYATPGYKNSHKADTICSLPELSENSGIKTSPFTTELLHSKDDIIRFTANNEVPDETSPILPHDSTLYINKTMTIRLRKYKDNQIPSQVQTYTYIFEDKKEYPTIFLTAPDKLWWGDSIGILYDSAGKTNAYNNVEIPVSIEYIKKDKREFYENAGCSLRGSYSRELPQKAFDIDFRNKYGRSSLQSNLYDRKSGEYNKFMLRNGGQDWWSISMRDNIAATLAKDIGIDYQAFSPTRVYINGQYWGHYTIQENSGDEYITSNYLLDEEDFSIVGIYGNPLHGNSKIFNTMIKNLENANFTIDSIFNSFSALFDMAQFYRYTALQIFIGNREFPGNNVKLWYDNKGHNPFRFILYDTDLAQASIWDYNYNTLYHLLSPEKLNWSNPPTSTILWRKFFSNTTYKNSFLLTLSDELNTHFSTLNYIRIIDSLTSIVENEMQDHRKRWHMITSDWNHEVQRLREFATVRQDIVRQQSIERFGLGGICSVSVAVHPPNASGTIKVSKSIATSQMQQAVFFQDVPLPLSITEHPQWKFLHWRIGDSIISTDKNVIMLPDTESMNIIAEFVQDSTTMGNAIPIVINEIMYKAADSKDMKDWIELTNYGNESYNIGSWILRDNDNSHSFIIPPNTIINPQEYIIIAEDTTKFLQYYPRPTKIIGEFDFGFGRGDQVRLFNAENFLIDSVHYGIISPWDSNADGTGQSLELQSPVLDNTLPEHWHATGNNGGTPGRPNTPGLFVQDIGDNANISIHRNNNVLEIHCTDTPQKLQCSLYSIHGNLLTRIHNIGTQTSIPLTGLSSGIYNVIIQEMATLRIIHRSSFSIIQ